MKLQQDRFVREKERKLITQISRTTAWKWEQSGLFPKRIKLGNRAVGWSLLELNVWLQQRREARHIGVKASSLHISGVKNA